MTNQEHSAQVLNLADLVQYQPGSVVSRTLINKTAGTVTLFAFDVNESLSEHTSPFEALVLLLDGSLEITIAKEHYRLEGGQTITLPANIPHALDAVTKAKMLLIMIR